GETVDCCTLLTSRHCRGLIVNYPVDPGMSRHSIIRIDSAQHRESVHRGVVKLQVSATRFSHLGKLPGVCIISKRCNLAVRIENIGWNTVGHGAIDENAAEQN